METTSIIINIGSTSKRYAFFRGETRVADFHMATTSSGRSGSWKESGGEREVTVTEDDFNEGIQTFLRRLVESVHMTEGKAPDTVAIRVVAPNAFFVETRLIDAMYVDKLEAVHAKAPLHVAPVLEEIQMIRKAFPSVRLVGVSDSAFHAGLPEVARVYPLPKEFRDSISRFGYHGISLSSSCFALTEALGKMPERVIVCHLGGGASITAIKEGKSVDTSMGFSPLSGIAMATRSGTLDTGALFELSRESGLSNNDLELFLNTKCGLVGLSNSMADVKQLIVMYKKGNADAKRALDYFIYSIQKTIGSYIAVLGGLDALVFSGAIGVGSDFIRGKVVAGFEYIGARIDPARNSALSSGNIFVEKQGTSVAIVGIEVDEMGEMMKILSQG
ncbi:MAG: hypothetical protein COV91_04380 [Candidatus Taylorbacteria bacterium CG11_big_fil_rev_8_21_14_0_20_46_11]|uniref:Acetate kinase n=1 Tax=Candidatus Taylorbacteria bacterium CG11_big_fil_rev_8_21_14_0_20_46_11 TaxID=1975025 RepID=A0A2H0KAV7_9BACT|nr:MAG: hypothetical protein COV91_04380 [Candidatus Taylorbacteria bacterium CG11_big_fil_rev_8_21_14_0_20_46_11]